MPVRPEVVRFGLFEVELTEGVLIKDGRKIKLQEQPFRLLSILLEHAGKTVTREELRQALWKADTFVDFDRGLNAAMAKLRQALGDSADNPRFIETQARRGYRFIAPLAAPVETVVVAKTDRPKSRRTAHSYWVAMVAVGALLIGAGIVYYPRHGRQSGAAAEALPHPVPLTTYPGFQWEPTFSPEGTRVAFAWDEPGKRPSAIYVKLIGPSDPVRLTSGNQADLAPAWSPDGRYIAFLRSLGPSTTAVMLIPSLGGQERELSRLRLDAPMILYHSWWLVPSPLLAWSSDSKWLFADTVSRDSLEVVRISVESGEQTKLNLFGDSLAHGVDSVFSVASGDAILAVSPDGRRLAFAHTTNIPNRQIFVVNLSADMLPAGPSKLIHFNRTYIAGAAWTPDGHSLLVSSDQRGSAGDNMELWKIAIDSKREPVRLTSDDTLADMALSKTAQRLVFTHFSGDTDIWRTDLRTAHLEGSGPLIASTRYEERPSYSSDGGRIAFDSDRGGNAEIWISSADGSRTLQLTSFGNAWSGSPRWSPDDRQIAFDSDVTGKWNVYVVPSEGGKPVRFTQGSGTSIRPSWSRDGKWIYYCYSENSGPQIWKKPIAGGAAIQITKNGGRSQLESADGAYVYYLKPDGRALWRVPANGGQEAEILALKRDAEFTLGTHGAYFVDSVAPATLKYLDFAAGAVKTLGTLPGPVYPNTGLAVSPDEHWLLYGKGGLQGSQLMLVENFR
ncbi:MAG: PD40 domain-containing protein [Acidobacteriaceae bacterium]|nr:PD40 domain-containing protein [Acidobacteriaceae bacterium]